MNKEELIEECLKEQIKARDKQIHELNEEIQKLMAENSNMERTLEIKQNHILMAEIERLNNVIKDEKDIRLKAIEYMERYMFSQKENYDYIHLSDILKGVDKE